MADQITLLNMVVANRCTTYLHACHHTSVASCCDIKPKHFFTFGRHVNFSSGIYLLKDFCGDSYKIAVITAMEEEDG